MTIGDAVRVPLSKLFSVAVASALGFIALTASLSEATARVLPVVAAALYPDNPSVLNRRAAAHLAKAPAISASDKQTARALARRSLALTLLNPVALRVMGIGTSPAIDGPEVRPWMLATESISHRDSGAHVWLARDAARRGDTKVAFDHVDYALRSSRTSSETLMPVLLAGLADPVVQSRITQLVREKVFWTGRFLQMAASESKRPDIVARIVQASGGFPEQAAISERILLTRLLADGRYGDALQFAGFIEKRAERVAKNVALVDQNIDDRIAPISWQINPDTTSLIRLENGQPALLGRIERDRVAQVANKLIYSAAGRVSINGSVQFSERSSSDSLKLEAGCPGTDGTPFRVVGQPVAATTANRQDWSVSLSVSCDPIAIRLTSISDLNSTGNEVTIWGLSLAR